MDRTVEYLYRRLDRVETQLERLSAALNADQRESIVCHEMGETGEGRDLHKETRPCPNVQAQFRGSAFPDVRRTAAATMLLLKKRDEHFNSHLFCDPAWAMLLDIYCSESGGRRLSVTAACLGSGAPQTTALRYLKLMESDGLVEREQDPADGRRTFVRLTKITRTKLSRFFEAISFALYEHNF